MMKRATFIFVLYAVLNMFENGYAQAVHEPPAECADAMAQWQSLGYGVFIHFGMSTFTGEELDHGLQPSTAYAPSNLDVNQWVRVARDAGMKYAVLTAKHVSGHCLWDSKVMWKGKEFDYDVATSSNKTDVIAAFMAACREYNLKLGLYYCLLDSRNNAVPQDEQWNRFLLPDDFFQLAKNQLGELLERHPELAYLWLDIPRAASLEQRTAFYAFIKEKRPECIVLFNHGTAAPEGPATIDTFQAAWPTDILNTERHPLKVGQFSPQQLWKDKEYCVGYEHCDTICKGWFWTAGDRPRPTDELRSVYEDTIAAGGNLLLNVPPDRTGRVPQYSIEALMDLRALINTPRVPSSTQSE